MAKNLVRIKYTGDERDLVRSTRNAERQLDQLEKSGKRHFSGMQKAAGAASLALGAGLAVGLKKSVEAAMEAEQAEARLEQAMKSVQATARERARAQEAVSKVSKKAALDDEELSDVLAKLTRATGNVRKGTQGMALAAEIARGRNISLEQASRAVEKAYLGNEKALARVGVVVPKVTGSVDDLKRQQNELKKELESAEGPQKKRLEALLESNKASMATARQLDKEATAQNAIAAAQEKFAGSSERFGKTAAGGQERFKVAIENVEESIGEGLLPVIADYANKLATLLGWTEKHKGATKLAIGALVGLVAILAAASVASKVYAAGQAIAAVATIGLGEAATTADKVMRLTMVGALFTAGVALVLLWKKSETFRDVVTGVFNAVKTVVLTAVSLILRYIGFWLTAIHGVLEAASHIPFVGDKFKAAARGVQTAKEKVDHLRDSIDRTRGKTVKVDAEVSVRVKMPAGARGPVTDSDGIMGAIGDGVRFEVARNPGRFMPSAPASGSAAGLKPMVLDDLALARTYGLGLTSGYRPGAVTSTGNTSLHSIGQAIDVAGPPMSMAMYAQAEAGRPGVAEVIYSPIGWWHPGAGWGPITNATIKRDHYSHVHVGVRSGDGLVGDGRTGKKKKPKPFKPIIAVGHASAREQRRAFRRRARRAAAAAQGPRDDSDTIEEEAWGQLPPELEEAIFDAEGTKYEFGDDIAAHQAALGWLRDQLGRATTSESRLAVKRAIREQEDAIEAAQKAQNPDVEANLRAQLEQANRNLDVARRTAALGEAFIGTGVFGTAAGGGSAGGNVIFQTLFPPSAEYVKAAGGVVAEAFGGQGYRPATREVLGI